MSESLLQGINPRCVDCKWVVSCLAGISELSAGIDEVTDPEGEVTDDELRTHLTESFAQDVDEIFEATQYCNRNPRTCIGPIKIIELGENL